MCDLKLLYIAEESRIIKVLGFQLKSFEMFRMGKLWCNEFGLGIQVLRKSQENEKNLRAAEEVLKQSTLTTFILYVALVASFSAVGTDKSWHGMVTNWMSAKNKDLFEDQTMNQCRFNVEVHRFVFFHTWSRCKQWWRHLTTFEPEMPKVLDWELIGRFQFCKCFSPVFLFMFLTRKWMKIMHLKSQSLCFRFSRILRKFVHLHAIEVWRRASSRAAESRRGAKNRLPVPHEYTWMILNDMISKGAQ